MTTNLNIISDGLFNPELVGQLDLTRVPKHVAIIPDGNRRWAKKIKENVNSGHREGADTLRDVVRACRSVGVQVLTIYTFSTENWNRSPEEIRVLMWILETNLAEQCDMMVKEGIRLATIGDLSKLPSNVQNRIAMTKEITSNCDEMTLVLAINYGSRDEIRRTFKKMLQDYNQGCFKEEDITESMIASYLDTSPWGDPDLLIRASGEMRVSNFLLWQVSYSEIFVTDTLWPDFTPNLLLEALLEFQKRERRLGGP